MPPAILAIAQVLITVGIGVIGPSLLATVFIYAASAVLLNAASKALAPKRRGAGLGTGTEVNYFDTAAGIRIVYGRMKVGGMETLPPVTTGDNNRILFKLLTLAGHEIDSYNSVHFDATTIAQSAIAPNSFLHQNSDGLVLSGTYSGHAYVKQFRGNSLAPRFDRIIGFLNLDSNARDIATVSLGLIFNQAIYPAVPVFTFIIQGKRVYDPRLDTSPGANPTNLAYHAWSSCPPLCLADYLRGAYGGSYEADEIDWATVVTAANYCDGLVNLPVGTQPRYTCNGVIFATDKFIDNVKALVDSMLGRIIFSDGKWRMYAGSWQTPSFTIPKNAWVGPLTLRFEQGKEKRFNKAHCFYIDADRDYQRLECAPKIDTNYLAADGEEIEAETEQLLCTSEYEAQRKCVFLLRQSRNQISVAGTLPPSYQNLAIWDTGTIVFDFLGWSSKTFRITSISLRTDGALDCVFTEEQEDDWLDIDPSVYFGNAISNFPTPNATTPTEPTSFSAVEQINGTILFTIGTPIIRPAGTLFQIIRSTNSGDASVGTVVYQGNAQQVPLVMPTSLHWYYVRSILGTHITGFDPSTIASVYQPNTFGVMARSFPESNNRFAKDLVIDPEIQFSSENGRFWLIPDTISLSVYSLSLAGGSIGGRIITRAASLDSGGFDNALRYIFAIPSSPFPRNIAGRKIQMAVRYRALTSIASKGAGDYVHKIEVFGWTGVNSFNLTNNDLTQANVFQIDIRSSNGAMPSSGQYVSKSEEQPLATTNVNSYPHLVAGIRVATNANSSQNILGANSGDMFEFDCVHVAVL